MFNLLYTLIHFNPTQSGSKTMLLIVPATFGTTPIASIPKPDFFSAEPNMPRSVQGASKLTLMVAKLLLATAFLVGLASTIAAST